MTPTKTLLLLVFCLPIKASVYFGQIDLDPYRDMDYQFMYLEGFKVYVLPTVQYGWRDIRAAQMESLKDTAIQKMIEQLKLAVAVLPIETVNQLRNRVVIRMDDECRNPVLNNGLTGMGYYIHQDTSIPNVVGEIQLKCYHFFASQINNRTVMIHELAHAWHDLFIQDGFDNRDIIDQFEWSARCLHKSSNSFWKNNHREFFAEMTASYFFGRTVAPQFRNLMHFKNREMVARAWRDPPRLDIFTPTKGECL